MCRASTEGTEEATYQEVVEWTLVHRYQVRWQRELASAESRISQRM